MGRGALVLRLAAAFLAGAFFLAAAFFRGTALGLAFLLAATTGFIAFAISPLLAPRIAMDLTIMSMLTELSQASILATRD